MSTKNPFFGCTNCYEDYTYPAEDLRVHNNELWCDNCWDEHRWDDESLPDWDELEPFVPDDKKRIAELEQQRDEFATKNERLLSFMCNVVTPEISSQILSEIKAQAVKEFADTLDGNSEIKEYQSSIYKWAVAHANSIRRQAQENTYE